MIDDNMIVENHELIYEMDSGITTLEWMIAKKINALQGKNGGQP